MDKLKKEMLKPYTKGMVGKPQTRKGDVGRSKVCKEAAMACYGQIPQTKGIFLKNEP